jgi:hypothetical protein
MCAGISVRGRSARSCDGAAEQTKSFLLGNSKNDGMRKTKHQKMPEGALVVLRFSHVSVRLLCKECSAQFNFIHMIF